MNYRKLFAAALAVNAVLVAALVWYWLRPRNTFNAGANEQKLAATAQAQPPAAAAEKKPAEAALTAIQLSPERMQSIGVTFGTVAMRDIGGEIRATGNVDMDERRQAYVQTRFAGWLRTVHVNATYQFVRKGQPLFTIYSPDLVATQQEYLFARKNQRQLQSSTVEGVAQGAGSLVSAARERLRQWQISDSEIARVEKTEKPISELTVYSPVTGYVTERNALPYMYVQPETRLYTVVDLSTVWIYAQVFQNDVGKVRPGDRAEVTVDAYPGKTFRGRVDQILPQVDATTRTVRVRLSFANPGLLLKPGMFVNVTLKAPTAKALVVPASAVLQSGTRHRVFMDGGNGKLDPREVQLGDRDGDFYVVRSGLKAGDRVVTSANFLIDSESQIAAAAGGIAAPPPGADSARNPSIPKASAELTTDPSPPRKGSNIFRVKLSDGDGRPISGAQVTVTFFVAAMPQMSMAETKSVTTLDDKGNGLYEGRGEVGSGGAWKVTILARQNGQVVVERQLTVSVPGGM